MANDYQKTAAGEDNFLDRITAIEQYLKDFGFQPLSELNDQNMDDLLTDVVGPRIVAPETTEDSEPTSSTFSGWFLSAMLQQLTDGKFGFARVINGSVNFGIGEYGIFRRGSEFADRHVATIGSNQREFQFGFAGASGSNPEYVMEFMDSETVLMAGDFESGDFTGWGTTTGFSVVETTAQDGGLYSAYGGGVGGALYQTNVALSGSPTHARVEALIKADTDCEITITISCTGGSSGEARVFPITSVAFRKYSFVIELPTGTTAIGARINTGTGDSVEVAYMKICQHTYYGGLEFDPEPGTHASAFSLDDLTRYPDSTRMVTKAQTWASKQYLASKVMQSTPHWPFERFISPAESVYGVTRSMRYIVTESGGTAIHQLGLPCTVGGTPASYKSPYNAHYIEYPAVSLATYAGWAGNCAHYLYLQNTVFTTKVMFPDTFTTFRFWAVLANWSTVNGTMNADSPACNVMGFRASTSVNNYLQFFYRINATPYESATNILNFTSVGGPFELSFYYDDNAQQVRYVVLCPSGIYSNVVSTTGFPRNAPYKYCVCIFTTNAANTREIRIHSLGIEGNSF